MLFQGFTKNSRDQLAARRFLGSAPLTPPRQLFNLLAQFVDGGGEGLGVALEVLRLGTQLAIPALQIRDHILLILRGVGLPQHL